MFNLDLGFGLGSLKSGKKSRVRSKSFNFETVLPSGWGVVRSGSTAVYLDSDGKMQQAAANTARIDHDASGNPLGILIENTSVNKVTAANINPTDTTGLTIISGTGTITPVDKTSAIAAAGLDGILTNGKVFEIAETAGGTLVVQLSDTVGNTNKHSWQAWAWSEAGTTSIDLVGVGSKTVLVGTQPVFYSSENLTPTATTRYLRANVTNNRKMYIILMKLEESAFNTSSAVSASSGAQKTRNRDEIKYPNLNTAPFWSQKAGAIIAEVRVPRYGYAEQGFFSAVQDSDSGNDQISVRSISGTGRVDGNYKVSGTDQTNENIGVPLTDDKFVVGIIWKPGEVTTFEGYGMRFMRAQGISNHADTLDTLYLGRTQKFFGYANIHVTDVHILKGAATLKDVAPLILTPDDVGIALLGQSQPEGWSEVEGVYTNGGEVAAIGAMNTYYTSGRNFISNMSIGGAGLYKRNNATNYFLENDGVTAGGVLIRAIEAHRAVYLNATLKALIFGQGETDVAAESKASLKAGWLKVFQLWRAGVAELPVYVLPPPRRSDSVSAETFYRSWHDAISELAAEYDWIHLLPATKVLPLVDETGATDVVHVNDAGWSEYAPWVIRKIASDDGQSVTGAVDYPTIASVSRSGTEVTVTLSLPSGITDFTPTTGIQGFRFYDDASEISITAAVRTNATTITLTLASVPTGEAETLYYLYGVGYGLDRTKLVRGNDSHQLPLQFHKESLPVLPEITTTAYTIAATADDVSEHIGVGLVDDTAGATQVFGDTTGALGYKVNSGLWFDNIALANAADLDDVYLYISQDRHPTLTSAPIGFWQAVDADDSAKFSGATRPSTVTGTTAFMPYITHDTALGEVQTIHDVTPVAQEIVDRAGWATGQAMQFYALADDVDGNAADVWDDTSTTSPTIAQLIVNTVDIRGLPDFSVDVNITTAQTNADFERLIDKAVELGSPVVRIDVQVRNIVSESGGNDVYDYTGGAIDYDAVMDYAQTAGVQVLPILHYFPDHWLPSDANPMTGIRYGLSPDYTDRFAAFIKNFDTRYAAEPLVGIQVMNEVNNDDFFYLTTEITNAGYDQPKLYAKVLEDLATEYTGYTKNFDIVHAGLVGADHEFMEDALATYAGYPDSFDVMAYHGYNYSPADGSILPFDDDSITLGMDGYYTGGQADYWNYPKYGHNLRKFLDDNGRADMLIWMTEYGYIANGNPIFGVDNATAARTLVEGIKWYTENIGVERIFIYSLEGAGDGYEIYDNYLKVQGKVIMAINQ